MRRYPRLDSNHAEVVQTFRQLGWSVQSLASQGRGVPDLLIGKRGLNALVEVKDGAKPPSARELTSDEAEWISKWKTPVYIITSQDDAIKLDKHFFTV